jgi:hypothetical protein
LLSRPLITNSNTPFDTLGNYIVYFASSGDQVFGNNLLIMDNATNLVVYDSKILSFQLQHIIPANTLQNGMEYKIKVRTFNINIASDFSNMDSTNTSEWSDPFIVKTFTTPEVDIINIPDGKVLNQTFAFRGNYSQLQGELLQSYKFLLSDIYGSLLESSPELFNTADITYEFAGLDNDEDYKIELIVLTKNGIQATSGKISFHVEYIQPKLSTVLNLTNDRDTASIDVQAQIIQILGEIGSGNILYEGNDWLDVKNGMVYFKDGFTIEDDFTLKIWIKDIIPEVTFLKMISSNGIIELKFYGMKVHVFKNMRDIVYHTNTNENITPTVYNTVFIFLQQVNNRINVKVEIIQ